MRPDDFVIPAPITPAEFHARGFEAILAKAPDGGDPDIRPMLKTAAGTPKVIGDDSVCLPCLLVVAGKGDTEGAGTAQGDAPTPAADRE